MLRLTIWMNYPSFYQGDLFRALVASGEVDLQVVFAKNLTPERLELGWQNDLTGYPYRFLDERNEIADAMYRAWFQRDRLHVVNGIWTEPSFAAALIVLKMAGSSYAIYSEASDPDAPRSKGKKMLQAALGKALARRPAGLLSVSNRATEFYKSLGVPDRAVYPFGYFRSHSELPNHQVYPRSQNSILVVFAGQIIRRKGLDLLIEAVPPLLEEHPSLHFNFIGSGELLPALVERVKSLGLSDRVEFEGVIPPNEIPARIAIADVLVLPSRWDGWGMVINEAFSVGVPVIVSDRCGSADLVQNGVNGYVFRNGDVADLRRCLSTFLDKKTDWPRFRSAAAATGNRISAEAVAPYLINCLKHMTGNLSELPSPPWVPSSVLGDVA